MNLTDFKDFSDETDNDINESDFLTLYICQHLEDLHLTW